MIDYAIIMGVIMAILISMNMYLKRGLQARVKDMTDNLISNVQEADSNAPSVTSSSSQAVSDSRLSTNMLIGGGSRIDSTETTDVTQSSIVSDVDVPYQAPFISHTAGDIDPAVREK